MNTNTRFIVLVALDSSKDTGVVETAARTFRYVPNAELHLLHVATNLPADVVLSEIAHSVKEATKLVDAQEILRLAVNEARTIFSGPIQTHLTAGTPWKEILQTATNISADCIVVAPHGTALRKMVLGSVSEAVAKRAHCQVIVARKKDYSEPPLEIEPPCPDCLAVQDTSAGKTLWCERHNHHARRIHTYHEGSGPSFGSGSMFVK